nr:sigma-54 dependent transcriptional regulator [Usitatibacter palustris]
MDRQQNNAPGFGPLIGNSSIMRKMYKQIEDVAPSDATVLVVGESGTGKELVARSVWENSPRTTKPLVAVNCGGIPASLLEAELFGHERGSFTGAHQRRAGYFEQADGGTLFLDEITEMPAPMQAVLLRALEEKCIRRVGGSEDIPVNVRVVAATNRDPHHAVRSGVLRQDLLYRLAVFPIDVPPLRDREGDVELLARHFVAQLNRDAKTDKKLSPRSLPILDTYDWPGNVRELRNAVHRAYILGPDEVEVVPATSTLHAAGQALTIPVGTTLASAQKDLILATLAHFRGDKQKTADMLGICLKTLYNRLQLYQGRTAARP